jgi:hypothetical protein
MKKILIIKMLIMIGIISPFIISCSSGGTSKVTIHINIGTNNLNALNKQNNSILHNLLNFFKTEANAQSKGTTAPTSITSLVLNITGDGMDGIHQLYSTIPTTITVEVPAGKSRFFEILAYTASVTFRGATTLNLSGEETIDLPIAMNLYKTKIIVPDYGNQRIVQIDDMSGTNWTTKTSFTGFTGNFVPYDIDFDNLGRIYIVNWGYSTGDGRIIRIDDITSNSCSAIATQGSNTTKQAIAIDRENNILYYSDSSMPYLYKYNINTDSEDSYLTVDSPEGYINGLALGNDGYMYITCGSDYKYIIKYKISTASIERYITNNISDTANYVSWLNNPFDITVKSGYVYIADRYNKQVIQLNTNLVYQRSLSFSSDETYTFFGPHRFVAILNKKFYVTDDDEYTQARISAFDDIEGNNFEVYGVDGSSTAGAGYFKFWCSC